MNPSFKPVSMGDVFKSSFPQRFKPKLGEAYRLFLPEVDCAFQAQVHYLNPNYVFCWAGNGINKDCPACQSGLNSTYRYGMNVVLYKTDGQGKLRPSKKDIDGKEVDAFDWDVRLWLFSQTIANELYSIRSTWNLMEHDVKVLMMQEKPQKISIQACPDSVFKSRPDLQGSIITSLKNGRRDPVKELGVMQTQDEITAAIAAGAGKKDPLPGRGFQARPAYPQASVQGQSLNSPGIISAEAGDTTVQTPTTGTQVREISNDKEFDELLNKIRQQGA